MTETTTTTTATDSPVSPTAEANTPTPLGGAFAVDAGKVQSHPQPSREPSPRDSAGA